MLLLSIKMENNKCSL